jgi:hypothetical protein
LHLNTSKGEIMKDAIQDAYADIITQELEEGIIRNTLAAAAIVGAAATGIHMMDNSPTPTPVKLQQAAKKDFNLPHEHLLKTVTDKFNIDHDKANHIVELAKKYSHPVFPQAHHILAIAGIESSFNDKAKSKLKFDPAVGLMQTRPKVWGINPKELSTAEGQIKHGAHILNHYYEKTGSVESAVASYNIGLTNHLRGKQHSAAHRYITKFKSELSRYAPS